MNHYMKLGTHGCSVSLPCIKDYYCPVGAGPCKPAKGPGKYCLNDAWCKGESKCLGISKCWLVEMAKSARSIIF